MHATRVVPYTVHQHDDFEPQPGLPECLPAGERLLWRGSPDAGLVLRHIFHGWKVALYFAVLLAWQVAAAVGEGAPWLQALGQAGRIAPLYALALALLALLARLAPRTTVYTLTSRRVVMRIGIALPTTFNLPFAQIEAVDVKIQPDGTGDVSIKLVPGVRLAYLVLWPHARPWALRQTQPTLRAVPNAAKVAQTLGEALAATCPAQGMVAAQPASPAPRPRSIMSHVHQVDNILRQEDLTVAR